MCKDYKNYLIKEIKKYKKEEIKFGKTLKFHMGRMGISKEEIKKEIFDFRKYLFGIKQEISGEIRYNLYIFRKKRRWERYVITFRKNKIRIITSIPIGNRTIKKVKKNYLKKFKKNLCVDLE